MDFTTTKGSSRPGILPASPRLRILILAVLAVMAAASTFVGVKEAAFSDPGTEGIDFQWSGAHLLSQHEDPWKLYIRHQDKGKIILGQQPNYLAELFLLFQPLGRMPFQQAVRWWCGLSSGERSTERGAGKQDLDGTHVRRVAAGTRPDSLILDCWGFLSHCPRCRP